MARHLLMVDDFSSEEIRSLYRLAAWMKARSKRGIFEDCLAGRCLGLAFHKPSLRTRVSFEVGVRQLGGDSLYLGADAGKPGMRESVKDWTQVALRFLDGLIVRTFAHEHLVEMTHWADKPVVNALTDYTHPCQALADFFTIGEHLKRRKGVRVAYIGDSNNVTRSLALAAARLGATLVVASPEGYTLEPAFVERVEAISADALVEVRRPEAAVEGADIVYTDVWASMGQEEEAEKRKRDFAGYRVDEALLSRANAHALAMHDLPAHRGEEITDGVMDGPRSIHLDQAENRMHVQKAALVLLLAPESAAWRTGSAADEGIE